MKSLLTICLLAIATTVGSVPKAEGSRQKAVGRMQSRVSEMSLNRAQKSLTRAQTREAERRLYEMGYWTGAVDGVFDPTTRSALIAFQKWEGRPVTGRLTLDELGAIRDSVSPKPRESGYAHVEVDLDRQVLLIVNPEGGRVNDNGRMVKDVAGNHGPPAHAGGSDLRRLVSDDRHRGGIRVLPISSGSGKPFMDQGQMSVAHTPRGRFLVYDKVEGWEQGAFRAMYYSNYISGGVAIHGYHSVPNKPESHGCIRIPNFAAREVSKLLPLGTIVLVYDKVSFVSGRSWAEDPKLKDAVLLWSKRVDN